MHAALMRMREMQPSDGYTVHHHIPTLMSSYIRFPLYNDNLRMDIWDETTAMESSPFSEAVSYALSRLQLSNIRLTEQQCERVCVAFNKFQQE